MIYLSFLGLPPLLISLIFLTQSVGYMAVGPEYPIGFIPLARNRCLAAFGLIPSILPISLTSMPCILSLSAIKNNTLVYLVIDILHTLVYNILRGNKMGKLIDITGQKFGRLTAIKLAYIKNNMSFWYCICECGTRKIIMSRNLRKGISKSCGCYKSEIKAREMAIIGKKNMTHGDGGIGHRARLYSIWVSMVCRCKNKTSRNYKNYGGRGIIVCPEWRDYTVFKEWALLNGYAENLSIDRIDVNGNSCPENCRWTTMKVQQNNKRNNYHITINGETKTAAEWADKNGISRPAVYARLKRGNNTIIAVTKPITVYGGGV